MFRIFFLFSAFIFIFSTNPVYAEDVAAEAEGGREAAGQVEQEEPQAEEEAAETADDQTRIVTPEEKVNPGLKKLNDMLAEITKPLDSNNRRHFFMLYNNHNMISTVKHVRSKVDEGIEACGQENPDMKEALETRFGEWKTAVNEKLDEAEAQRDNMIEAQDYVKKSRIRNALEQADKLRKETNDSMGTTPVTTKEACEYLLNKMDETQNTMLSLLRTTLVTLPQAIQNLPVTEEDVIEAPTE